MNRFLIGALAALAAAIYSCSAQAQTGVTAGAFQPSASGARMTPFTANTSDSSGPLPKGPVVVVSNAGTTNPMYCNVYGIAATVADWPIPPNYGSWVFTIPPGITTLHCIATGGSTTVNGIGGYGLPSGSGGGGSGTFPNPVGITLPPDVSVTGAITAAAGFSSSTPGVQTIYTGGTPGNYLDFNVAGMNTLTLSISGTFGATVGTFIDNQNGLGLVAVQGQELLNNSANNCGSSWTAPVRDVYYNVAGLTDFYVAATSYASGTVNVAAIASGNVGPPSGCSSGAAVDQYVLTNNVWSPMHVCGSRTYQHITTATDTQLVAISGSTNIYVCDYSISFAGAGTSYLESASAGSCGGTVAQIDLAWTGVTGGGEKGSKPIYTGLSTGASNALCVHTSSGFTGPMDISVSYDQY